MTCKKCGSDRILSIMGHCVDCFSANFKDIKYNGYVPRGLNIGGGDDLDLDICMECGQVQADFPVSYAAILQKLGEDQNEDKETESDNKGIEEWL